MSKLYVGIDCGLDGAMVAMSGDYPHSIPSFFDAPTLATGHGARRTYDIPAMVKLIEALKYAGQPPIVPWNHHSMIVALEQQQAMPQQGVTSMFSLGFGFGVWQGLLTALGIPFQLVHPTRWKKEMMAGSPKDKAASCLVASRLFPLATDKLKTERGRALHGRADALLLAEFMRRHDGRSI
jgi:hypothetical protein